MVKYELYIESVVFVVEGGKEMPSSNRFEYTLNMETILQEKLSELNIIAVRILNLRCLTLIGHRRILSLFV